MKRSHVGSQWLHMNRVIPCALIIAALGSTQTQAQPACPPPLTAFGFVIQWIPGYGSISVSTNTAFSDPAGPRYSGAWANAGAACSFAQGHLTFYGAPRPGQTLRPDNVFDYAT